MDYNRIDADILEEDHIEGKRFFECLIGHGVTAILDDDGLAAESPDIGKRLHERIGFFYQLLHGILSGLHLGGLPLLRKL